MAKPDAHNRSVEDELLVALIEDDVEPARIDALIKAGVNWHLILDKAVQEGIFYPLYKNLLLIDSHAGFIPEGFREKFRQTYYHHIAESAHLSRRIERVLGRIESSRIKVLLFKGPAIDALLYDDFVRPRLDLDIVVEDRAMAFLEEALRDVGYQTHRSVQDEPLQEYRHSRFFIDKAEGLLPVHVHTHLINNSFLTVDNFLSMDMGQVWDQTEPFKSYRYIRILKPELGIAYLCEHGLKHNFDQMVYLYEIDSLVRCYGGRLDWEKLVALAQGFGLGRGVYYGFLFLQEALSARVPREVMASLRPARFTAGEKMFIRNTLRNRHPRYASYPVYVAMREGWRKKANFFFRTLFPPEYTLKGYLARGRRLIVP